VCSFKVFIFILFHLSHTARNHDVWFVKCMDLLKTSWKEAKAKLALELKQEAKVQFYTKCWGMYQTSMTTPGLTNHVGVLDFSFFFFLLYIYIYVYVFLHIYKF
jgi:hypothetical protein